MYEHIWLLIFTTCLLIFMYVYTYIYIFMKIFLSGSMLLYFYLSANSNLYYFKVFIVKFIVKSFMLKITFIKNV